MRAADRAHLAKLVEFGCVACFVQSVYTPNVEIHHLRSGVGMGQRSDHKRAIPLCPPHHRTGGYGVAFHAGKKAFEEQFGSEEELLSKVMGLI